MASQPKDSSHALECPLYLFPPVPKGVKMMDSLGGKAETLITLARAGLPVPQSVAVPYAALHGLASFKALAGKILGYDVLRSPELIVRSSANYEDGAKASFAGQFLSLRCGATIEELADALEKVYSSSHAESVAAYSARFTEDDIQLSLLVQDYHQASISGVAFSKHPTICGAQGIFVEWINGNLEDLVQGQVTPKSFMLATESKNVPGAISSPLLRYIPQIVSLLNAEVDVEWLQDKNGEFFVLQARPITTTAPRQRVSYLARDNIGENYPKAVTPLLRSLAARSYYYYYRSLATTFGFSARHIEREDQAFRSTLASASGYLAYNLDAISSLFARAPMSQKLTSSFAKFIGMKEAVSTSALPQYSRFAQARELGRLARMACSVGYNLLFLKRDIQRFSKQVMAHTEATRLAAGDTSLECIRVGVSDFLQIRCFGWKAPALADAMCMLLGGVIPTSLLQTAEVNPSPVAKAFEELLSDIRKVPQIAGCSRENLRETLAEVLFHESSCVSGKFHNFIQEWGFRRPEELVLTEPDYEERPDLLLEIISQRLINQPVVEYEQNLKSVPKAPPHLRLLQYCYSCSVEQREYARLMQARLYTNLRRLLLKLGRLLKESAIVESEADVFYFTLEEIEGILQGTFWDFSELSSVASSRKSALSETSVPNFPLAYQDTFHIHSVIPRESHAPLDCHTLLGTGASPGMVQGEAQIVNSPQELRPGVIAVTSSTDPGWVLSLPLLRGLIVERGGILSHAAILSREYGIPTIVGVSDATKRITDGQRLELDGSNGIIKFR